jgi:phosphoserine aminotransferase
MCMKLLHLPEKYHISILDGGADTCVLGQVWEVLSVHNTRRANVLGFDHKDAVKMNLPIVSTIPTIDDLVTKRSITGILIMLNNTPIRWVSKRQKRVETSTYGLELV